ncbi:MAG: NAD(P)/FAD-dependent oxidoreductase [Lachnospiraceae bacterium]|nr:NAD(P)/FAD-dependent oxidoreductase [Lachnospiraceae bacterium]
MERYDIAVIGTGPGGLEAAITAKVRNKSVLLLGSRESSEKVAKAHTVQNYLGLKDISGADMSKAFVDHALSMGLEITEDRVNAVYSMGKYFAIQGHNDNYEASSVILAVGMTAMKPLPGEMEFLGRAVSYCATCDAALYKGRTAIVVAYSSEDEAEAAFLAERADKVYYLPQYDFSGSFKDNIEVMEGKEPVSIEVSDGKATLNTKDGSIAADGIFILREQIAPSQLVPGLKLDGNHVEVDRSMATNIKGLFACGDITGTPYQYIKAAGEGNVAALSAVSYLQNADK